MVPADAAVESSVAFGNKRRFDSDYHAKGVMLDTRSYNKAAITIRRPETDDDCLKF